MRHLYVRAGLCAAALASVATSQPVPEGGATLVNHRHFPLTAEVADGPSVDCDSFDPESAGELTQADFERPYRVELAAQSHQLFHGRPCGLAWVKVGENGRDFDGVVAWRDPQERLYDDEPINETLLDVSVMVEGGKSELRVTIGDKLSSFPPPAE